MNYGEIKIIVKDGSVDRVFANRQLVESFTLDVDVIDLDTEDEDLEDEVEYCEEDYIEIY